MLYLKSFLSTIGFFALVFGIVASPANVQLIIINSIITVLIFGLVFFIAVTIFSVFEQNKNVDNDDCDRF